MTTYTAIPDSDIDPESPGTTTVFVRLRNNPLAIQENDPSAPDVVYAISAGTSAACSGNSATATNATTAAACSGNSATATTAGTISGQGALATLNSVVSSVFNTSDVFSTVETVTNKEVSGSAVAVLSGAGLYYVAGGSSMTHSMTVQAAYQGSWTAIATLDVSHVPVLFWYDGGANTRILNDGTGSTYISYFKLA
jgi:hypothetical protein